MHAPSLVALLFLPPLTALTTLSGNYTLPPVNRTHALADIAPDGVPITPFIVGGTDAFPGQYPWVALVVGFDQQDSVTMICTGVLIRPYYILTARSCVFDSNDQLINAGGIDAYIGITSLDSDTIFDSFIFEGDSYTPEYKFVSDYTAFAAGTVDLAILELASPSLLPHLDTPAQPSGSSLGIVTGWGTGDEALSIDTLQVLDDVPILPDAACSGYETVNFDLSVHICAGFVNGVDGACYLDYGAPLVVPNSAAKHGLDLIGTLISHTLPCGADHAPDLYSDLVLLKETIESVVGPPTTTPGPPPAVPPPTPSPVSNPGTTSTCACSCSCTNGFNYDYQHAYGGACT